MEKRTVIALVLIIIIFYISSEFVWKPRQQTMLEQTQPVEEVSPAARPFKQEIPAERTETTFESIQLLTEQESIPITDDIFLENDNLKITFTNAGASITGVELKHFLDKDRESNVNLIRDNRSGLTTTIFDNEGIPINLEQVVFSYQKYSNSVEFTIQNQDAYIKKTYRLVDSYQLDYSYEVNNFSAVESYRIGFQDGIADTEEYLKDKKNDYRIFSQIENQLSNRTLNRLKEPSELEGKIDWIAVRSKYFLMALIPGELNYPERGSMFSTSDAESPAFWVEMDSPQASFTHQYRLYLGPLLEEELVNYGLGMEKTVQMGPGVLRWLSKIFRSFFIFLYGLIQQWGVCIIIFSFLMKLVLYPLTHKSFESSMKMQEVQPKMKSVQDKYKHDPRLMNKEVQKLYKEHGVNPMSGCLPMLPQFPIIIALMPIFRNALELRQAEFLWMSDLSEPDPYLILPITMAVFMFIQQMLMRPKTQNPDEMDDKQKAAMQSQKMMGYIMPIVMFFLFKSFPAGLVIYWTSFNIFSLIQQYYIRKKFDSIGLTSEKK